MKIKIADIKRIIRETLDERAKRQTCSEPECGQPAWANTLDGPLCYAHAQDVDDVS